MVVAFGGDPQAPRPPFAGLDPLQQRIVGALAGMLWIWQAPSGERIPADNPLWAYGLPNTQRGLQAYVSNLRPKMDMTLPVDRAGQPGQPGAGG
jgi:hypothetical protein